MYSFTSSLAHAVCAQSAGNYVVDVMTVTEITVNYTNIEGEKTPLQSKCSFGIGRLGIFVQFAHKNNSQDFKHECKKALLFKWFLLKVSEGASAKNCL